MFISTSTNLTISNSAAYLSLKSTPASAQLPRTGNGNLNGNVRRSMYRSGYGVNLGCASSDDIHALASGTRCTDIQMFSQSNDLDHVHEETLSPYWHKHAAETNGSRRPVNYQPIWKPIAFINNQNRLTCRWQEPSI